MLVNAGFLVRFSVPNNISAILRFPSFCSLFFRARKFGYPWDTILDHVQYLFFFDAFIRLSRLLIMIPFLTRNDCNIISDRANGNSFVLRESAFLIRTGTRVSDQGQLIDTQSVESCLEALLQASSVKSIAHTPLFNLLHPEDSCANVFLKDT